VRRCAVYRFYDELGSLLYVGISYAPNTRAMDHRRKCWWPLVRGRDVCWFENRIAAHAEEKAAIESEWPRFNLAKGFIPPAESGPHPARRVAAPAEMGGGLRLLGAAEIGELLGVSRQRVQQLITEADFPEPVASLAMGKIWTGYPIRLWAESHGRLLYK